MRLFGWARSSAPVDPLTALSRRLVDESESRPRPGAAASAAALESRYGIRLPDDFRRYLLDVAPFREILDEELTTWWPSDRIRSIPDEYKSEIRDPAIAAEAGTYLFFADYIFWCWVWAICCSEGPNRGRIAFIGGADGFVADSFSEFVQRYLADPDAVACTMPQRTKGEG